MAPDPTTAKSRGSRYRANDSQYRGGEGSERDSQRSEMGGKGKGEKESGGADSGRAVKKRQHACSGVISLGAAASISGSASHRSWKRWRGDGSEASDVPSDRWDGGASDPTKESNHAVCKGKQEIDANGGDGTTVKNTDTRGKEAGGTEKVPRKQRMSRACLASDNRAITVMDLQESDVSIIDTNIRIKNKVSHRKDFVAEATDSEVEKSFKENMRSTGEVRIRNRWDRGGVKDGAEEVEDGPERGIVGSEESRERDKRKEKLIGRDRDQESMKMPNGRKVGDGTDELGLEAEGRSEVYGENDQSSNEWKIQEDLRNVELEKELENRIRRRREESGDRDRWRVEDRERDVKRYSDTREDRTRDDRHREDYSRKDRDRVGDKNEQGRNREGSRPSDGKLKDDRHYESDREYRPHREERSRDRSKDVDDQVRGDRAREQDYRDRVSRDRSSNYEPERRIREKGHTEDGPERERLHSSTVLADPSEGRNEHRAKRARESDAGEGLPSEREQSRHAGRAESDTPGAHDYNLDGRSSRDDRDSECRPERIRGSPKDSVSMRGKVRGNHWRHEGHAPEVLGGQPSSPLNTRASPSSNRIDYPSPPRPDDRRSPDYVSQRSPSPPHVDVTPGQSRVKGLHGDWFERSNSVSSSNGTQKRPLAPSFQMCDRRDRTKWIAGADEEVKSGPHRSGRNMEEVRDGSLSPHRVRDQHMVGGPVKPPLHGQDSFSRGSVAGRGDRERWRGSAHGGSTTYDGGQMDSHIPDDLSPRDRNDRGRRMPMNRPPGSPMLRPQLASLSVPPLAPLPPPPPFRPGIDNPAVLGPTSGGFDDGCSSRDQGRVDRKGVPLRREGGAAGMGHGDAWRGVNMGNWNTRNQGPLPGNAFPPFPPQFAPHSSSGGGGFAGLGQQFPVPPIFPGAGGRPPMDMGFGGRFMGPGGHMGENGDGFLGPGRIVGWHGPGDADDGRGPPMMGPVDGWEGPGPHGDDRHRHGRMDWERNGPMGVRVWERERERELWEGRVRDGASDFMPLRSQMEPPLQNTPFAPGSGGWGMPRESQGLSDLKPRPERPPYDPQESKRKLDGVPQKMKAAQANSKSKVANEEKRSKYVTAAMQSVLTQLHISPELAGPDLYKKYRALLPVSESDKQMQGAAQDEDAASDSADDDLCMEVDTVGEGLITAPKLVPKLLPPLPDGVFQAALEVYRKAEKEKKLQKSIMGSFVMPFDPATFKLPSVNMNYHDDLVVMAQEQPLAVQRQDECDFPVTTQEERDIPDAGTMTDSRVVNMGEVLEDRGGSSGLDAHSELPNHGESEFDYRQDDLAVSSKPEDRVLAELGNNGDDMTEPSMVRESKAADFEDREGDAVEEFLLSHVEVAEYSDREFEAEMEETLEELGQGVAGGEQVVQARSGDVEEIRDGMTVLAEVEEGLHRDAGDEGSEAVMNFYSVTEIVEAGPVGDEGLPRDADVGDEGLQREAEKGSQRFAGCEGSEAGMNVYSVTEMVEADAVGDEELQREAEGELQKDAGGEETEAGMILHSGTEMVADAVGEGLQRDAGSEGSEDVMNLYSVTEIVEADAVGDEGLQRDAGGEGSGAGIDLYSVTEMGDVIGDEGLRRGEGTEAGTNLFSVTEMVEADAVGDESPCGNYPAESHLGDAVEVELDNVCEAEELQRSSVVSEEEDVVPMLEGDQRVEAGEEARFEGNLTSVTQTVPLGHAATDGTSEMDASPPLGRMNEITGEGGPVSEQDPVTMEGLIDREVEVENSGHDEKDTSDAAVDVDETYPRADFAENVNILMNAGAVDYDADIESNVNAVVIEEGLAVREERMVDLEDDSAENHPPENVNILEIAFDHGANLESNISAIVIEEKPVVRVEKKVELEVVSLSEPVVETCVIEEANDGQAVGRKRSGEVLQEASVSDTVVREEYLDSWHNTMVDRGVIEEQPAVGASSGEVLPEATMSGGVKETAGGVTVSEADLESFCNPTIESCVREEASGGQPADRGGTDDVLAEGSGDVKETVGDSSVCEEDLDSARNPMGDRCTVEEACTEQPADRSRNGGILPEASVSSHDDKGTVGVTAACEDDLDSSHIPMVETLRENVEASTILFNSFGTDGSDIEESADKVKVDRDGEDERHDQLEESDDQHLSDNMPLSDVARFPAVFIESGRNRASNGKLKEIEEENRSPQLDSPARVVEVWKLLISVQRKDFSALNESQDRSSKAREEHQDE
ncbi:hypothetical protein R1flu_023517 [Riccia fluitans]|uniref:Uncharacterized protein n=1 Tax=Riccia fluitans TaxID=41844 RepID=A0ABD1XS84_9MARC